MYFMYYIYQILERTGDQCDMKVVVYLNEIGGDQ